MLFWLTRKFPPQVGGMEKFNYELTRVLGQHMPLQVLAHGGTQRALPLYVGRVLRYVASTRTRGSNITGIHLGDALLAPVGLLLSSAFANVPVSVSAHGLDVTYAPLPYQLMVRACLKRFNRVMCNSSPTMKEVVRRGVPEDNCRVITPGATWGPRLVSTEETDRKAERKSFAKQLDVTLTDGPIIITVGRLVRRKGVVWFIRSVLPRLWRRHPELTYLVVGDGPERRAIVRAAQHVQAGSRVVLTGRVEDNVLTRVYAVSDAFVMPNVQIPGDPEGFGIAALDASVAGLWVFASAVDGIPDAVIDGRNGTLIDCNLADQWSRALSPAMDDPEAYRAKGEAGRAFTLEQFAWSKIADRYLEEFRAMGVV